MALAPDGTTVLLSKSRLPRESEDAEQRYSLDLHTWTPEGALRWSQRAKGSAPDGSDWETWVYSVRATSSGLVILDNPAQDSSGVAWSATGLDLGCGPLFHNRLIRLDSEGRCLNQVKLQGGPVRSFTTDGAGDAYVARNHEYDAGNGREWASLFQRFDVSGQLVAERKFDAALDLLTWNETGGLRAVLFPEGRGGLQLHWLSPGLESLRSRDVPSEVGWMTPTVDGRLVSLMFNTRDELHWGEHEFARGSFYLMLSLDADGAPGAAFPVQLGHLVQSYAADEHGMLIVGKYPSVDASGMPTQSLELHAYGWDGALQHRQVLATAAEWPSDCNSHEFREKNDACWTFLWVSSLEIHPVHGIRIAGQVRGPAELGPNREAVPPRERQSFVMSLRR